MTTRPQLCGISWFQQLHRRLETTEFAVLAMGLIERSTQLSGEISICLATFCEAFVLAVRELIRAEFFDDAHETFRLRPDDNAVLRAMHLMRYRIFASKSAR